jgi:hypothetical protein
MDGYPWVRGISFRTDKLMLLDPGAFNAFLGMGGAVTQQMAWRRAYACPCFNPASGAAVPSCQVCGGKGHTWDDEVIGNTGLTNQSPAKMMAQFGVWEPGDAILSIPSNSPLYAAGWYDRFRALGATNPFSRNLTHGTEDVVYGTLVEIDRVFWIDTDGITLIDGDIPDFDDIGNLTWEAGEIAPAVGQQYSVTGTKFMEYYAYRQLPANRNVGIAGLPLKLPVRSFDLFSR